MYNRNVTEYKVKDFEKSYHFYTEYLGFKEISGHHKAQRVLLAREEVQLHLHAARTAGSESRMANHQDDWNFAAPMNSQHTTNCYRFNEIQSIIDKLNDAGIEFLERPEQAWLRESDLVEKVGLYHFRVVDPDGNILSIAQELLPSHTLAKLNLGAPVPETIEEFEYLPVVTYDSNTATELLIEKISNDLKVLIYPSFITYLDYKITYRFEYDTSRHMHYMFALLQRKQQLSKEVCRILGANTNIEICALPDDNEHLDSIQVRKTMFDLSPDYDRRLNAHFQLYMLFNNLRVEASSLPRVQDSKDIIKH